MTSARRLRRRVHVRGRELRVDGSFSSCALPEQGPPPAAAVVWYAIAAPLAWAPAPRSMLVLGLGGATCVRVAGRIHPRLAVTGVEIDPDVVRAARRHFGLDALGVDVRVGDARELLARTRRRFDVIVEDVFCGSSRRLHKPTWLPRPGLMLARRRLRPGGLLVVNTIGERAAVARELRALFARVVCIDVRGYENHVLVGSDGPLSGAALSRAARACAVLRPLAGELRFRTLRRAIRPRPDVR